MELKNYLHLYLGAEVYIFPAETLSNGWYAEKKKGFQDGWGFYELTIPKFDETIKAGYLLVLRPLSDMTEEERKEAASIRYNPKENDIDKIVSERRIDLIETTSDVFHYLLSKHFDLFGLIKNGLAIDKTKI